MTDFAGDSFSSPVMPAGEATAGTETDGGAEATAGEAAAGA